MNDLILKSDDGYTYRWNGTVWTDGDIELTGSPRHVDASNFDVGDMVPGFTVYEGGVAVLRIGGVK